MSNPIDNLFTMGNSGKADSRMERQQDVWSDLITQIPDAASLKVILDKAVYEGDLAPEQAEVYLQEKTAFDEVSTDPRLAQAQMAALSQLQDRANEGGLNVADRGRLQQIASDEAAQSRGQREAILQNAAARGVGGSGLELASQLGAQQASAGRQSQRDFDVAALAQQSALQSLQQGGALSGQMRDQSFGEQSKVAQARDAMSQFNAQNRNRNAEYNTLARNQAAERNINTRQDISNQNTQTANQQNIYNTEAPMRRLGAQTQIASGQSGALGQAANHYMQQGENSKNTLGNIIGAAAGASDIKLKQDVKDFDPDEFLDSITGYKYRYTKPDKYGDGEHAGVMAQDLEKTEVGKSLVEDTPEGKMVDFGKGFGAILASLSRVNDKVKALEERS